MVDEFPEYPSVKLQSDMVKEGPVAIAQTDEGVLALRGVTVGPEVSKIQQLRGAFESSK